MWGIEEINVTIYGILMHDSGHTNSWYYDYIKTYKIFNVTALDEEWQSYISEIDITTWVIMNDLNEITVLFAFSIMKVSNDFWYLHSHLKIHIYVHHTYLLLHKTFIATILPEWKAQPSSSSIMKHVMWNALNKNVITIIGITMFCC